jgi:hypothetical protein
MMNDTTKQIHDLNRSLRALQHRIQSLEAQQTADILGKNVHYSTFTTPNVTGKITFSNGTNDAVLSKTVDVDKLEFSGDWEAVNGTVAASTITVGDQVLSEDGTLVVSDADTPGIVIKDTSNAYNEANCATTFVGHDKNGAALWSFEYVGEGDDVILGTKVSGSSLDLKTEHAASDPPIRFWIGGTLQVQVDDGAIIPNLNGDIDLGSDAKEFKNIWIDQTAYIDTLACEVAAQFGAFDVNFANGTTYKVKADGDAVFKNLLVTDIGSATAEIGDVYIADAKKIYLGSDQDIEFYYASGELWLKNNAAINTSLNFASKVTINFVDQDDSNEVLMALDTGGRTFRVGAADGNDDITSAFYGDVTLADNLTVSVGNVLMGTTADSRIRLPYLAAIPGSADNGSIWMEADGLHLYYNGAEKVVAGV